MIRNILTRIFSGESLSTAENQPTTPAKSPVGTSLGVGNIPDSFQSTASKNSAQFDLGLLPRTQDSDATKTQEQLLKEKEKSREEEKKLEEMTQDSNDKDFFGSVGSLFGDDKEIELAMINHRYNKKLRLIKII